MKPIKMLGLAALMALLAMVASAPSAMAEGKTALCTSEGEPEGKEGGEEEVENGCLAIEHVHEVSSSMTLLSSSGNVTCSVLFLGDTESVPASPLIIEGNFTYTGCKRNGSENCTVTEENGPAYVAVLRQAHETATVTGKGEVRVKCGIFINCVYNSEGVEGTAKGPLLSSETNGDILLDNQEVNKVSGLCPSTAKLDITTTPLEASYIVNPAVTLPFLCGYVGLNHGWYNYRCAWYNWYPLGSWERIYY